VRQHHCPMRPARLAKTGRGAEGWLSAGNGFSRFGGLRCLRGKRPLGRCDGLKRIRRGGRESLEPIVPSGPAKENPTGGPAAVAHSTRRPYSFLTLGVLYFGVAFDERRI